MDVPCHNCGKYYPCNDWEYQGYCDYCETNFAIAKKPGEAIHKDGTTWIRMADSILHHLEGFYFNPETGEYHHASVIVYKKR